MLTRHGTLAVLLAVSGCASAPSGDPWTNYACTDGQTVQARYPDTDTAVIQFQGRMHSLHVAMSGSGARYVGDGWQWWTKGMHDGMLAPLATGETIASTPGVACHAD